MVGMIFSDSIFQHFFGGGIAAVSLDAGLAASLPRSNSVHDPRVATAIWSFGYFAVLSFLGWLISRAIPETQPLDPEAEDDGYQPSATLENQDTVILRRVLRPLGGGDAAARLLFAFLIAVGLAPLPGAALVTACVAVKLLPAVASLPTIAVVAMAKPIVVRSLLSASWSWAWVHTALSASLDSLRSFDGNSETGFIFSRAPVPLNTSIAVIILLMAGVILVTNCLP